MVEIRLYATLRRYAPPNAVAGIFSAEIPKTSTVNELLNLVNIPVGEVHILMVNGISTTFDHLLKEGDRIGLFPAVGGG